MGARRFSGSVAVSIRWDDGSSQFVARVTAPNLCTEEVRVGAPAVLDRAVDSPLSFDAAARAAIVFASSEFHELAEYGTHGVMVHRSRTPRALGERWKERGLPMVQTSNGPDVYRGACGACGAPAVWIDAHDGSRGCPMHSRAAVLAGGRGGAR